MKSVGLFILGFILLVGVIIFGFVTKSALKVGDTVVDRVVFEQSYQRSEAKITQRKLYQAQILEINNKLMNPNLDKNTKYNLEAQKSGILVMLNGS